MFQHRYVHAGTRSIDGNFHQHLKKKKHDPEDVETINGAYFPESNEYENYLARVGDSEEVRYILQIVHCAAVIKSQRRKAPVLH